MKSIVVKIAACFAIVAFSASFFKPKPVAPAFKVFVTLSKAKDHIKMMTAAKPFLEKIAAAHSFVIDITDDTAKINDENLKNYQVFIQLQQAPFDLSIASRMLYKNLWSKVKDGLVFMQPVYREKAL